MLTITLTGHCPSKANRLRQAGRGRLRIDPQAKSEIGFLQLQANQQRPPRPLLHPTVSITFRQRNGAQDRDNKLKTILDIMQEARIIANDNVRLFNGRVVLEPAVVATDERVVIVLEETPRPCAPSITPGQILEAFIRNG